MDAKALGIARRNRAAAVILFALAVPIQVYGLIAQGRVSFLWIGLTAAAVTTYLKCDSTIRAYAAQTERPGPIPQSPAPQAPTRSAPPSTYDFFGARS